MVNISFESILNFFKQNIPNSLIKIWHILLFICILIIIVIIALIPLYLKKNNKSKKF
jgi:hypothetical protein